LSLKSWAFDLLYLLARTPWDTQVTPPEVVALIEGGELRPGRALDLGCGTGTNSIYLARRGWDVVGVDFSTLAVRRARRKAREAGVACRFHRADVTNLSFLRGPFDLVLDIGCLHGLPREAWGRYAGDLARLVRAGGLYMLYAFLPRPGRATRGIAPGEVRDLLAPAFTLEGQEGGDDPTGPQSVWYWMRKLSPELPVSPR
jgi:SAM-dependent methyltransferase